MNNKEILAQTDRALNNIPAARKMGLIYALVVAGISLIVQLVGFITTRQMDSFGGLGGLQMRTTLSFIQNAVSFVAMLLLPFLQWGHKNVALRTAQGMESEKAELLGGLHRFGPLLRFSLLRIGLWMMLLLLCANAAGTIYLFLPQSAQVLSGMEAILTDPNAMMDEQVAMEFVRQLWPMYAILGVLLVAVLAPITYRLRLADWAILEGENRALKAMLQSYRTMRGKCVQLFQLDLRLIGYYLLMGVGAVLSYGDVIFSVGGDLGFWVFFLLSLAVQTAVTALLLPKVDTAYGVFYRDKTGN